MPTNGQFAVGELVTASDANTLFMRGYQNRIINGAFVINQRAYASGANLASGAYGLDRWKSGYTNTALTFTAGSQSTTVTISTSGVLQQIVERENMPAGQYVLSWSGTATGRVYNVGGTPPAYGASPQIVTLDGLANVVVEFTASGSTKTLGTVQLEAGPVFSPFEYRPRGQELAMCQRYFESSYELGTAPGTAVANNCIQSIFVSVTGTSTASGSYAVTKRVRPTMRLYSTTTGAIDRITVLGFGDTVFGAEIGTNRIRAGVGTVTTTGIQYHYTADAEL
jgi:hypothetical protein